MRPSPTVTLLNQTILRVELLEFERTHYHVALERLKEELRILADEKEAERFNDLWEIAYEALDPTALAVSMARQGILQDIVEGLV